MGTQAAGSTAAIIRLLSDEALDVDSPKILDPPFIIRGIHNQGISFSQAPKN